MTTTETENPCAAEFATPIGVETVLEKLREIVALTGEDYVYPPHDRTEPYWEGHKGNCVYRRKDGTPACIVGHVLSRLGILKGEVVNANLNAGMMSRRKYGVTDNAVSVLVAAQTVQDADLTWGHALRAAEEIALRQHAKAATA